MSDIDTAWRTHSAELLNRLEYQLSMTSDWKVREDIRRKMRNIQHQREMDAKWVAEHE